MSSEFYDAIIVGAGPAGSYAASELALLGYGVAVLEQKSAAGMDVCCTGIVSSECFDSFAIDAEVIFTRANSAKFFSPSGKYLRLQSEKIQAYIVNRASFDKVLATKAQAQNARYFFSSRVTHIILRKDRAEVQALCHSSKEIFSARAVILANGFGPTLCRQLGLGETKHFLVGAQTEVDTRDVNEVEIYLGQQTAPGSFAWLAPISANRALAGLLATSHARLHLERFLLGPFCQSRIISREAKIRQKAIPLGTLPRTYGDRILVIGDAAGQVKPITGGGIYFGHLGAKIATEVLKEALEADDLAATRLSRYQKRWKARINREILLGYRLRRLYNKLSEPQIERIFDMLDSGGIAKALLSSPTLSFDWHSKSILAGLKYSLTYPLRKARHFLPREVGS